MNIQRLHGVCSLPVIENLGKSEVNKLHVTISG